MTRIVADVDTGIDDACALTFLACSPQVDLVACSTVSGNTTAELAAHNTAAVLQACGNEGLRRGGPDAALARTAIPVVIGRPVPLQVPLATTPETHGPTGLGHAEVAPAPYPPEVRDFLEIWRDAVAAGPATLLLTGPLTNLAVAIEQAPDVVDRFDQIVIMGGAHGHPGNTTERAEWNTWCDPDAAARVHSHFAGSDRLPVVCGLDITETIILSPERLSALALALGSPAPRLVPGEHRQYTAGPPVLDLLVNALSFYFQFHLDEGSGYLAHVHDLLAAVIAAGVVDVDTEAYAVQVGLGEAERAPLT